MIYYEGQLKDYDFNVDIKRVHHKRKDGKKKSDIRIKCYDIFTFDIECTSGWIDDDGSIIGYHPGEKEEYWNNKEPVALCYIWQFSVNDIVYYGRTLEEFKMLLDDLPEDMECIIWDHNLAYEFAFLVNILEVNSVFAKTPHKPIKCNFKGYEKIEFRCTYFLSNMSLEKWGKELNCLKHTGDLDYEKIRTPLTKLTKKEMDYAEQDCIVVYNGILNELKTYKDIYDIPMTSTGKVRRKVKEILTAKEGYQRYIKKMCPDVDTYKMLIEIFAGGYTHANRYYAGRIIDGHIEHYDFTSAYPTAMIAFSYPCGKWVYRTETYIPNNKSFDKYAFIFKLTFKNIKAKGLNTYIQKSKCEGKGIVNDNGRVVCADELNIMVTEYDWMIIKKHYEWDELSLIDSWYCKKDYLPKEFIEYILELYNNKTQYKGIEEYADTYAQSKAFLNALYGMTVTAIVQGDCELIGDEWVIKPITREYVATELKKLGNIYRKHDNRYFLNYSWGVWVTAIARYMLWMCIDIAGDENILYCDTDSIFCKGHHDFTSYNKWIVEKLENTCKHYKINPDLLAPLDKKGKSHMLGIFDKEPDIKEFKTLHAKCYCYKDLEDKLQLTVSGINKDAVNMLTDLDDFEAGFNFDKDNKYVKKRLHTYLNNIPDVVYPDGYKSTYRHGINMRRTGYKLGSTDEYDKLIRFTQELTIDDISDITINQIKGWF